MADQRKSKPRAEQDVARRLRPAIRPYLVELRRADRLIGRILAERNGIPARTNAPIVCVILLSRLSNDLRACELLAPKGHVLQAWTIGSSALESAYSIGHVGTDVARAKEWMEHKDSAKAPWPAYNALGSTLSTFGLSHNHDNFYKSYRQLSAAKHGNPLLQRRVGVSRTDSHMRIQIDPFYSEGVARLARFGIAWTLHAVGLGLWAFIHHYPVSNTLANRVGSYASRTTRLLKLAETQSVAARAT